MAGLASHKPEVAASAGLIPLVVDYVHSRFSGRLSAPAAATYAVLVVALVNISTY